MTESRTSKYKKLKKFDKSSESPPTISNPLQYNAQKGIP